MPRKSQDPRQAGKANGEQNPRVIRITPDGREIVDPLSIIESRSFRRHLEDIKDIPIQKRAREASGD